MTGFLPHEWNALADSDLTPAVLVVPGVVLLGRKRRELRRLGRTVVVVWRRRWGIGLALIAVGLFGVVRGWPFTVDRYPPWQNAGLEPYQTLIDQVDRLGGVTMWSFPEAADVGQRKVGPVQVAWLTEPYADDLLRTFRYTAFGAVYEQPTRFTDPGLGWDRLLGQYVRGERSRPAWAVAESGFHGLARGKRLGPVRLDAAYKDYADEPGPLLYNNGTTLTQIRPSYSVARPKAFWKRIVFQFAVGQAF